MILKHDLKPYDIRGPTCRKEVACDKIVLSPWRSKQPRATNKVPISFSLLKWRIQYLLLQVNCLSALCSSNRLDKHLSLSPRYFSQHWRFGTTVFLHYGILDCGLNLVIQLWIGRRLESTLGWLRMAFVYFAAGIGGHIVSKTSQKSRLQNEWRIAKMA